MAGIILFLVFNSSRAVNEKINLVNAADAAAYSGAQVAARQLNFMAHTNRVMIANEVAIGHMVSYQAEVETISNGLKSMGGSIGEYLLDGFVNYFLAEVSPDDTAESSAETVQNYVRSFTGAYVLGVSANNAAYTEFLNTEYDAMLGINGEASVLENTMLQVAEQYISRPSVTIALNSEDGLDALRNSPDPAMAVRANEVLDYRFQLCQLLYFATPSNVGDGNGRVNPLRGYCRAISNPGNGRPVPGTPGGRRNPVNDAGIMFELIELSAQAAESADWITNRNLDYRWGPIFGVSWAAQRRGATRLEWDTVSGQYQWVADSDSLSINEGADFSFFGESNPDNNSSVVAQGGEIGMLQKPLMEATGICDDIDCDALAGNTSLGHQTIQTYLRINPNSEGVARISAVLTQTGLCNDSIGIDADGNEIPGFDNEQYRFPDNCDPAGQITAVGGAEVYYSPPSSAGPQAPNLFNPYWQARLSL